MAKDFKKTLFLFRRDLRLEDNTGLLFALRNSISVIPAFILTPEQTGKNPYKSSYCLKFMLESLLDLDRDLKEKGSRLYLFTGKPEDILKRCIQELSIDALVINRDYTPYSKARDAKLEKISDKEKIAFFAFDDVLLHPPETTLKKDKKPYSIFTPYFRNAIKQKVAAPAPNKYSNYFHAAISFAQKKEVVDKMLDKIDVQSDLKGGRKEGLKILKNLSSLAKYGHLRDYPAEDYTSHLSAYLKFTVCSPREVYAAIKQHLSPHHELIRSLYWRDFFTMIAWCFPHVFEGSFYPKYDKIKWSYDRKRFQKWCKGETGFPIVDAGMREMNKTGFMHNRVRMIAASFLVKDLHIDWRWGEKYFAQTLIDYDPSVNNGNWQWVASTGCDAQPYFRIFNPWNQQKKFDPECIYIKKWIPELADLSPKIIHKLYQEKATTKYPSPMIIHENEAKVALKAYKAAASK